MVLRLVDSDVQSAFFFFFNFRTLPLKPASPQAYINSDGREMMT